MWVKCRHYSIHIPSFGDMILNTHMSSRCLVRYRMSMLVITHSDLWWNSWVHSLSSGCYHWGANGCWWACSESCTGCLLSFCAEYKTILSTRHVLIEETLPEYHNHVKWPFLISHFRYLMVALPFPHCSEDNVDLIWCDEIPSPLGKIKTCWK